MGETSALERTTDGTRDKVCGEFTVDELRSIAEMLDQAIGSPGIFKERPRYPSGRVVYFLAAAEGFVKIGFTGNLGSRVCDIQTANPTPLRLLAFVHAGRLTEREYHRRFADARLHGEWFRLTPEIEAEIERLNTLSSGGNSE